MFATVAAGFSWKSPTASEILLITPTTAITMMVVPTTKKPPTNRATLANFDMPRDRM